MLSRSVSSRRVACAALAFALIGPSHVASSQTATVESVVAGATYLMRANPDVYEGPGAEFLLQQARAAEFLMVGESHGNQETPALMTWLLRELRPAGYEA